MRQESGSSSVRSSGVWLTQTGQRSKVRGERSAEARVNIWSWAKASGVLSCLWISSHRVSPAFTSGDDGHNWGAAYERMSAGLATARGGYHSRARRTQPVSRVTSTLPLPPGLSAAILYTCNKDSKLFKTLNSVSIVCHISICVYCLWILSDASMLTL